MGSTSDWEVMSQAAKVLKDFGVPYEARALSAHRTPEALAHVSWFTPSIRRSSVEALWFMVWGDPG